MLDRTTSTPPVLPPKLGVIWASPGSFGSTRVAGTLASVPDWSQPLSGSEAGSFSLTTFRGLPTSRPVERRADLSKPEHAAAFESFAAVAQASAGALLALKTNIPPGSGGVVDPGAVEKALLNLRPGETMLGLATDENDMANSVFHVARIDTLPAALRDVLVSAQSLATTLGQPAAKA